jgi:hypothetical protein
VKSRLPRKPQPVPPIFQPEVAADAIYWAAHQDRSEIAPRFADWYLARTGYNSQQTDEPVDSGRRDNLWKPVPGDHGAHGEFDARSIDCSAQFWMSKNRAWLALAALLLTGAVIAGWKSGQAA